MSALTRGRDHDLCSRVLHCVLVPPRRPQRVLGTVKSDGGLLVWSCGAHTTRVGVGESGGTSSTTYSPPTRRSRTPPRPRQGRLCREPSFPATAPMAGPQRNRVRRAAPPAKLTIACAGVPGVARHLRRMPTTHNIVHSSTRGSHICPRRCWTFNWICRLLGAILRCWNTLPA